MNPATITRRRAVGRPGVRRPELACLRLACLAALAVTACACRGADQPVRIDLLSLLPAADKRPHDRPAAAFALRDATLDGRAVPAVAVPVPSRITWTLRIPRRATLTARVGFEPDRTGRYAGDAVFRIGISGGKLYEPVFHRRLSPATVASDRLFVPIAVDLSAWAGWQWSLFYRPSEHEWNVVFGVDGEASAELPLWLEPAIAGVW